ncbi:hypothetical protein Tsubulata_035047 [Turnera subulata]|uniref:Uncharacterized protein n=1 Tax=Turnera subulata TaxID=218843 RepID=A0A9Q0FE40_9ROSI|nr:hypothetical protein Tsubulata_035047 [Turnera subulata]
MEAAEGEPHGDGDGVRVSLFDYSVENHFDAMDAISKLCEETETEPPIPDETEIRRLSSSITFLREWRHFCYSPRMVRFACESDSGGGRIDIHSGLPLPQFSSATVPQKDKPSNVSSSVDYSADFVMYVGGSVWGLDWCPRIHEKPNCRNKCEFLAVAAHSPESYYHKIGVPLSGRGIIQIWCVVNPNGSEEEAPAPMKKRKLGTRPKEVKGDVSTVIKKPRGRPRKIPQDNEATKQLPSEVARPRGRPRKIPQDNEATKQLSTQIARPRGRPRKNPQDNEATKQISTRVARPRGRPRKKPIDESIECSNQETKALAIEYPIDSFAFVAVEPSANACETEMERNRREEGMKSAEAVSASNSLPKASMGSIRLKKMAREKGSCDISLCPPLLTYNENEESSPLSCEGRETSAQDRALDNTLGANVAAASAPEDVCLPRLVLCLAHNGKVAWDVKWRPNSLDSKCQHRMGFLAVLLGNGSLEVWDVPLPHTMRLIYSAACTEGTDPRFVKVEPVFRCSSLKCGGMKSIPLTVEWSTSQPHDYLLVGCHDGLVALWKFAMDGTSGDTRPLLCFSADTVPIRAVAWAPVDSHQESTDVILTAGHAGLKFWDLRDPFRPLWDLHPTPKLIYSLDWLPDPRCIILSFDDGTMRLLSLVKAAYDAPVYGEPTVGPKQQGMHVFNYSSSAIWSVHVSRLTGIVAYTSAEGTVCRFQLTAKAVDKDPSRNRAPHFMCGSVCEDESAIVISTPLPDVPLTLKRPVNGVGDYSKSNADQVRRKNDKKAKNPGPGDQPLALCYGDDDPGSESDSDKELAASKSKKKPNSKSSIEIKAGDDQALVSREDNSNEHDKESGKGTSEEVNVISPKMVAMHRVRWNMNKGSERWLCFGGAAGVVRCQEIKASDIG